MESLEADLEALKEDNRGTKEMLQQLTQQLATLMTREPHEPPLERSQRQPEQHPLQNPEQREGNYKPNSRTDLPNFTNDSPDEWLRRAERFGPGHKCRRALNILIVQEEEKSQEDFQEEDWAPLEHCSQEEGTLFTTYVSLNSIMRLTQQHKTMKEELSLPVSEFHNYGIVMGNEHTVQGHRICHNIPLKIQDLFIIQDFLPLDLSSTDVILGMQWLKTRVDTFTLWAINIMKFMLNNTIYTIRGDASLNKTTISFKVVERELKRSHICAVELHQLITRFLRLTGYYRRFKNYFHWDSDAQEAFHKLKVAMIFTLVLALPNFSQKFVVETDASGHSIGAILMQEGRPVTYFSHGFKEQHYLMLHPFIIRTNQYSLKFLFGQKEIHSEYHKWITKLMGFNFQIQYKEGKKNETADALSRAPQLSKVVVAPMCTAQGVDVTTINKELVLYKDTLIEGSTSFPHYSIQQRSLLYKDRWVLPLTSTLLSTLLRLLQPLPIPNMIWEVLSMDFTQDQPKSKGYDSILVIKVIKLRGIPRSIVTDRGTVFTSAFRKALNKLQGTELKMSSSYHSQTDGQTEMMTPFKAVYGRDPPTLTRYGSPMSLIDVVDTYLKERDDTLQLLKEHLLATHPRFSRPYLIQECIGQVAYKLELLNSITIHPIFHISQLCNALGNSIYFLVKWADLPNFEATWELTSSLHQQFPNFHLEDKVKLMGGSIDKAPRTYARRKKAQSPISQ
ncbi:unnamed protein product [Spirodela intermedia]|uniref:Integrase catalytic domain-containing protein n=1 Tax=Spirodela intermedia TaxID=51605 RepID=A0A7I8KMH8_SPIIN|nr:unnamed protein product [Spirodela intermedia]